MIRTKLPFGGITPEQMEKFADVVEKYAPLNKGHITTRQNIQLHHIPLREAAKAIRELSDAGLSSREGCGNTVRNVTGDPWAGVCEGELFDPTPYVGAYVRYFVRHPTTQLMPRKVKTAFTATDEDRAITGIHDVAFIPRIRDGVRGFEMRVGGGTSVHAARRPDPARVRHGRRRRVPEGRPRRCCASTTARTGCGPTARGRASRCSSTSTASRSSSAWLTRSSRATGSPSATSTPPRSSSSTTRRRAPRRRRPTYASPNGDGSEYERWAAASVVPQRQPGFSTVQIKVVRGDLTPEQFRGLAEVMRQYSGGYARTTVHQNLVLRWVRNETTYEVWQALSASSASATRARTRSTTS